MKNKSWESFTITKAIENLTTEEIDKAIEEYSLGKRAKFKSNKP